MFFLMYDLFCGVGIVLKMAHLVKDDSKISYGPTKPPSKNLMIPAKDLVQVIAKVWYILCQ